MHIFADEVISYKKSRLFDKTRSRISRCGLEYFPFYQSLTQHKAAVVVVFFLFFYLGYIDECKSITVYVPFDVPERKKKKLARLTQLVGVADMVIGLLIRCGIYPLEASFHFDHKAMVDDFMNRTKFFKLFI